MYISFAPMLLVDSCVHHPVIWTASKSPTSLTLYFISKILTKDIPVIVNYGVAFVSSFSALNHAIVFPWYGDFHVKDKTVARPSYLYHGYPYTAKMTSLYWYGPQIAFVSNRKFTDITMTIRNCFLGIIFASQSQQTVNECMPSRVANNWDRLASILN